MGRGQLDRHEHHLLFGPRRGGDRPHPAKHVVPGPSVWHRDWGSRPLLDLAEVVVLGHIADDTRPGYGSVTTADLTRRFPALGTFDLMTITNNLSSAEVIVAVTGGWQVTDRGWHYLFPTEKTGQAS
jgi:hypothetical protein